MLSVKQIKEDKMTALQQMEKARKRYIRKVDKAQYHGDLADAATEYISKLEEIIREFNNAECKTDSQRA